jgi:hypothetical protein
MFYQRPAYSIEEHRAVYDYMIRRLEEWGYTEESSKLDPACKSGIQPFWIPGTNRAHPNFAFFRAYGTKKRDLDRCAIDPARCVVEQMANKPCKTKGGVKLEGIDFRGEIEESEARLKGMTCNRHFPFFKHGVLLAKAGLERGEIECRLREIAGNEPKMRRKIRGVLNSLSNYGLV